MGIMEPLAHEATAIIFSLEYGNNKVSISKKIP